MWLILGGLLIFIDVALCWLFQLWHWWLAGVIAGVIAVVVGTLYLVRFFRARSAASKLEKALVAQGSQQAMNARPERRAEIQELQKQLVGGINALKSSKLSGGKKSGAAALYTMPWYMIVGPPGAGKTTALKHSGLVFPYSSGSGGGVRGVGGTRNCDWWFTNEAILLDTAGRYTTEQDDRDEWLSFLQFLLKYRNKRPINGILIAISITDLIDANEQQIEITGKKLRARIDEVMTQLHMVVPVYVLFTKIDLIAGFNEFFGDLRKSDRAQAWGTTFKLDVPKNEPAKLFDAEFDTLLKQLHQRSLKRMANERSREAREKIFGFPLEFAGLKRNLSELMGYTFAVNAFQGTPILRGFYFTSGTQEGRPLDRVLGRMGQAMGIPTQAQQQQGAPVVESKSYFLHDVFMNIVFPDGDLAARSAGEVRRQWLMRVAISASALALACILAIPAVTSALNNRSFVRDTEDDARKITGVKWDDDKPANEKLPMLDPALKRLQEIDGYRGHVPLKMGWWMYSGEKVYKPTLQLYVDTLTKGFVGPVKDRLEGTLKNAVKNADVNADHYVATRNALKMYLMLTESEKGSPHLDVDWATGKFTRFWVENLVSSLSQADTRALAKPHVNYYFTLVKNGSVAPPARDEKLVEDVRKLLQAVPVHDRYYAMFVGYLAFEKYDEAGDDSYENMVFKPIVLNQMFIDRPKLRTLIVSKHFEEKGETLKVEGPYTDSAHYVVFTQIENAEKFLEQEAWVVPLTDDEKGEKRIAQIERLAEDYEHEYVKAWKAFFEDIHVKNPTTIDEGLELWDQLWNQEGLYPYLRLLRALRDNTQWNITDPLAGRTALKNQLNQSLSNTMNNLTGFTVAVDISNITKKQPEVPAKFKSACKFASDQGPQGNKETDVRAYSAILQKLSTEVNRLKSDKPGLDLASINQTLADRRNEADALLSTYDDDAKEILKPLLDAPLTAGTRENNVPKVTEAPPPGQAPPPTNAANGGIGGNKWAMPKIPGRP